MLSFGQKIKQARKSKNMTQKELALRISAKHNSVSDWENDKNKPDPDTIELLCGVLGISPNYLLGSATEDISPAERIMINKYRSLDQRGKDTVDFVLNLESENKIVWSEQDDGKLYPYLGCVAAAGSAVYPGDIPIDLIKARRLNGADFIVGVTGDSMEPTFFDGDNVYVEKTTDLDFGDIGLFIVNGYYYIKELAPDGLRSHNPKWGLIPKDREIIVVGKVLGKVEE